MAKITILGCGFGCALAVMLDKYGHQVTAWSKYEEEISAILRDGEHKKLLPGIIVPPSIRFTTDISCVKGADILIVAIPSGFVREVAAEAAKAIEPETVVLNVGKGFEPHTNKFLSQVIKEEMPHNRTAVMAGPCHAEEIGRSMPTTVVIAGECCGYLQETLMNECFRIYYSSDIAGCEIAAALKNTIALCSGIIEGMGLGDNTVAALMTRGLAEITRLGVKMGARLETFSGLAGVGDLIVTCTSNHSRNHRAGILIGQGMSAREAIEKVGTVEGYGCTEIAYNIAKTLGVSVPIIEQLWKVCYENLDPFECLRTLMSRPGKQEQELFWTA